MTMTSMVIITTNNGLNISSYYVSGLFLGQTGQMRATFPNSLYLRKNKKIINK